MGKQMDYDEVVKWIDNRVALLEHDRKLLQKRMHGAPPGNLAIYQIQGYKRYYQRISSGEEAGRRYLSAGNPLVIELAQKGYDQEALKAVELERKIWMRAGRSLKKLTVRRERVYGNLSVDRRSLVRPLTLTSEMRRVAWAALTYSAYLMYPENLRYQTKKGHMVRSKSELYIANELYTNGIDYKYECELTLELDAEGNVNVVGTKLNGGVPLEYRDIPENMRLPDSQLEAPLDTLSRSQSRRLRKKFITFHPDFTIYLPAEDKVLFWEHNGALDDADYMKGFTRKMSFYRRAGLFENAQLLLTYESEACPLDFSEVDSIVASLKERC